MNNTNESVLEIYNRLAIESFINKAFKKEISENIKNIYDKCKDHLNELSLQDFAAYISNYNPNKAGIGEESQIKWLEANKFQTIKQLPNHGKNSFSLYYEINGSLTIKNTKSNLTGIKSFDAIAFIPNKNEVAFFILKTVDIGLFSNNIGGGHQKNVQDEIISLIEVIRNQNILFDNKLVKFYIIIDGRSADKIIKNAQKAANNDNNIIINESEKL